MSDRTTSVNPAGLEAGGFDEHAHLQAELDSSREEILRLRDLLIAKDAELGAAKGRLAELEEYSRYLSNAAIWLQARVPGAMRLIGAALRRLQSRRGRASG